MRGPEMVAPMTVYLLLDEAWNINGKIFAVAGGQVGLLNEIYPRCARSTRTGCGRSMSCGRWCQGN